MVKKKAAAKATEESQATQEGGSRAAPTKTATTKKEHGQDARATVKAKPSAVVDTRVIYCGDNLEKLKKLPEGVR